MKKIVKIIAVIIMFLISLGIFRKLAGLLSKKSKRNMAKLA